MVKKKKQIILIGAGGHAESCIDLLNEQNKFILKEVLGKKKELRKKLLNKYTVKYDDSKLKHLVKKYPYAVIGVGQITKKNPRIKIFELLKKMKYSLPKICSKHAIISKHSIIGEGSVVMHGAIIGAKVKIGKNCIINSNSLIEHGSIIGDHSHISTSATINSGVTIDENCFIGSNSVIKQSVHIKKNSFIKMGSVVKN
tara:strand:+ start:2141 stop:2737 length:597 start_codon:yes stop_codon:yes gene_type:complete